LTRRFLKPQCTQAKEAGTCANKKPYYLDDIEKTVLSGLKHELRNPGAIKLYIQSYNDEMKRLSATSSSALRKLENRLLKAEGELNHAIDAVVRGIVEPEDMRERIASLKQDKKKIEGDLERLESSKRPIALHPTAMASYMQCVENLEQVIRTNSLQGSEDSKTALRQLVDAVVIYPPPKDESGMRIEVRGYLSRLVGGDLFPQRSYKGGMVVAEEGLEPPTRGL
jgi:site-specific DNA recombinase